MAEITCPSCGTVIALESSELDSIVHQVRDEEFRREVEEREKLIKDSYAKELDLVRSQAASQQELAVAKAVASLEKERDALSAAMELQKAEAAQEVVKAVASLEKERDALSAAVEIQKAEAAREAASFKETLTEQLKAKDEVIAYKQEEIDRIKDMRARLSTKMVGETLEQHCSYEFERIRSVAFPNAYFEKDNDATDGSKGDFIFRETDEDGNEIISIMFEMKNLTETNSVKRRNEEHLPKLDKDRNKKNCEYAILVSLLEPENELYNEGIVDMSHRFPKMYVIRPQFFIPLISLLRNAAQNALVYKQELALVRKQELDITNFEEDLNTFKEGFFKNFSLASQRFDDTIKSIDKAIKDLQTAKEKLLMSEKQLGFANKKLEDLSVKKLTRKNPTMREKFEALEEPAPKRRRTTKRTTVADD